MIIKLENNEDVVTYQYDDSVEGVIPELPNGNEVTNSLLAGLPTAGISTDPVKLDYEMFINLSSWTEIRIFANFDNAFAIGGPLTDNCTKNIAFCFGMQATILAFNKESEGEYQRIRRIVNKYYEEHSSSK